MLVVIILLVAATFASLIVSGFATAAVRDCRRTEKENISRVAGAMRRLKSQSDRRVSKMLQLFAQKIEESLGDVAQRAAEGRMSEVLAKLRVEQGKAISAMQEFLGREAKGMHAKLDMRMGSLEKSLDGVTSATSRIGRWLKGRFSQGHKNGELADGKGQLPEPGAAAT